MYSSGMNPQSENTASDFKFSIPANILDDLCCRFIINVPAQEKKDLVRICFQIEQAHWFYLDFYSSKFNDGLKPCGIKDFARNIFHHIHYLRPFIRDLDLIIDDWKEYKYSVPTFGAIIIDEESKHILLVKSYWSKSSWGFPKGKINKDETPCHCAAREVYEETGFNISSLIYPNVYIESIINEQCVRLYIVCGVSRNTKFNPQTRNEIKDIKWFPIDAIPLKKIKVKTKIYNTFYMVIPFMRDLRKWILQNGTLKISKQRRSFKSFSEVEDLLHTTYFDSSVGNNVRVDPMKDPSNTCNDKILVKNSMSCNPENETECYEGSDEDDVKKSNEEIYGIPKVKLSYLSGKELDSYLLTCSGISFTNYFHTKSSRIKQNNLEPSLLCLYEKDLIIKRLNSEDTFSASQMSHKSKEFKVLPCNDGSAHLIANNSSLSDKIKNNITHKFDIEKNISSVKLDKNINLEKQKNAKNAVSEYNTCKNIKVKGKTKMNSLMNLGFNSYEKNKVQDNQRFIKRSKEQSSVPKNENEGSTTNEFKNHELISTSNKSYKNEYIHKVSKNKLIQAMSFYKFDQERLFKCLE